MFAKTAIVALFAGLVAAQRAPVGEPSGNPITRPLNEIVPACVPFTITWEPTTPNSVSLVLLRGPSSNVVPIDTLATGIANSGSFVWTPSASLEAVDTPTGYGLQLIDDITGQFQYSTQFGISKGDECNVVSSSAAPSSSSKGYPVASSTPVPSASKHEVSSSKAYPVSSHVPTSKANTSTIVTMTSSKAVLSTGVPAGNSTIIQPTRPLTVPSTLIGSPTGSALPESTGAASSLKAGLSLVGAFAAMAYVL